MKEWRGNSMTINTALIEAYVQIPVLTAIRPVNYSSKRLDALLWPPCYETKKDTEMIQVLEIPAMGSENNRI